MYHLTPNSEVNNRQDEEKEAKLRQLWSEDGMMFARLTSEIFSSDE